MKVYVLNFSFEKITPEFTPLACTQLGVFSCLSNAVTVADRYFNKQSEINWRICNNGQLLLGNCTLNNDPFHWRIIEMELDYGLDEVTSKRALDEPGEIE